METQQHAYPDFTIQRQCVAHELILDWQSKQSIPGIPEKWPNFTRPVDAKLVPAEPSLLLIGDDLGS